MSRYAMDGCAGCATTGGAMACPTHGPSKFNVIDALATMHPHQWRTDFIDGRYAVQTCAVAGCGIVRTQWIDWNPELQP